MTEQTGLRKLLVLDGPGLDSAGILGPLESYFEVHIAHELDEALAAMREGRFDAVLAETGDFLPLERGIVMQHASVVLEEIGDGVCVVGADGKLVWTNNQMRQYPPDVLNSLRDLCGNAYEQMATGKRPDDVLRGRRFSLMRDDGTYYEVLCSPVRDRQNLLRQVVAVVVDATSQRRQQIKLNAIERAGRELVRLQDDSRAQRNAMERLNLLEERILRYCKEVLEYRNFCLLVLDEASNRLQFLVSEGLSDDAERYELFANAEGNGICGYVAATGNSYICPDVSRDGRYMRGFGQARSSLTVPLRLHDRVVGILNVESDRLGAFREEDRQFAEIFGNYVALALHILNLLATERFSTRSQLSGSLCTELAGPIEDIIAEASEIKEDYIGHDDLRKRLDLIVDHAAHAREVLTQLSRGPVIGKVGRSSEPIEADAVFQGKRVLVADDESIIRETVSDVLRPHGCEVDVARDGAEAITLVGRTHYDLIISDIKMPGATGYEVFAAAKAASEDTAVILMTAFGYDPNHSIVRANREGLKAILFKPFKVRQLLGECRSALGGGG